MSSLADTTLYRLEPEQIDAFWDVVEEPIAQALERDGLYGPEHVREWLAKGLMHLWIAGDADKGVVGLALVEELQHPREKVVKFWLCTGHDRKRWLFHMKQIETWAKERGCTRSIADARKGWAKELSDYRLTHVVLEKRL